MATLNDCARLYSDTSKTPNCQTGIWAETLLFKESIRFFKVFLLEGSALWKCILLKKKQCCYWTKHSTKSTRMHLGSHKYNFFFAFVFFRII